jgi:hypothetical protein
VLIHQEIQRNQDYRILLIINFRAEQADLQSPLYLSLIRGANLKYSSTHLKYAKISRISQNS